MASRFHISALGLAAWLGFFMSAPATGCAEGEEFDPNALSGGSAQPGSGGQGGSMQTLAAGGSSGTPDTNASGGSDTSGSGGSSGGGNVADSGTPGSGGMAQGGNGGSAGSAGTSNMPMDAAVVVVPPDAPLAMGIVVFYKAGDTTNLNDQIRFFIQVVNNGSTDVPLSTLKVRYYVTDELNGAGRLECYDYNTETYPGGQNRKNYTFMAQRYMMTMVTGANAYFEFTVNSNDPLAAKSVFNLQCANISPAGQPQDESNDYSANLTQTTYAQTTKIVVYQNTTVLAGTVPM